MNMHDILTELWRLYEGGDTKHETRLESTALDFQDLLHEKNQTIGKNAMNAFIGPFRSWPKNKEKELFRTFGDIGAGEDAGRWAFTSTELDGIRHYYGQKIALENENPIIGIGVPLGHEVMGDTGITSPHWKESLYDLYVNAIGIKDHYLDKGLPGTPFHQMLQDDNITPEEFEHWGRDALKRVPTYDEE